MAPLLGGSPAWQAEIIGKYRRVERLLAAVAAEQGCGATGLPA